MVAEKEIVLAILGIFGVGVIGIVQTIKRLFHTKGKKVLNLVITAVVSLGASAAYLAKADEFSIGTFILYGAIVFGEASGLYSVYKFEKPKAKSRKKG